MPEQDAGCPFCRRLGFAICAVVFGGGGLLFVSVLTWGAILIPLEGLIVVAPLVLFHYLVWGQSASGAEPRLSEPRP